MNCINQYMPKLSVWLMNMVLERNESNPVDSRLIGILFPQKQSRNTAKNQYTYRSLILYLLKSHSVKKKGHIINYACWSSSDQNKINKHNQCLKEKRYQVMSPPRYFHGKLIRWRSLCMRQQNDSLLLHLAQTPKNFRCCASFLEEARWQRGPFSA